jgi:Fe-S cluster assembly protein SufD
MNRTALKSAPEAAAPLLAQHDVLARHLPGRIGWLAELRANALERFRTGGLPGKRDEGWRWTPLTHLGEVEWLPAPLAAESPTLEMPTEIAAVDGCRVVMVNGSFDRMLCDLERLPKGVTIRGIGQELARHPDSLKPWLGQLSEDETAPLAALNTASFHDGVLIHIAAGVELAEPIHVISVGIAADRAIAFHPRLIVALEPGARATVVESHAGVPERAYLSNGVSELYVGRDALLRHYKVQDETAQGWHLCHNCVRVDAGGRYESTVVHAGARLARHETRLVFAGPHGECRLDGAYIGGDDQHIDNTTLVDHAQPHCVSRQLFKGVLGGKSRGVYQGKVRVARGAQKTDAHQLSRALLLSPGAEMDGKPELEIYADDVKCGHGAAVGELDDAQLFYLESRGIDREAARRLLIEAFVAEVLENVSDAAVREALGALVRHRLARRH